MDALSFKLVGQADWVKLIAMFSQEEISPSDLIREGSLLFSSSLVWERELKRELLSLAVFFFFFR